MKTYYELLSVDSTAAPDEIKRAFRREIARYHPDKVQHLGPEFQEIAATRAAELTEAYRILMDEGARLRYDEALREEPPGGAPAAGAAPPRSASPAPAGKPPLRPEPAEPVRATGRRFEQDRATVNQFVQRAIVARLRDAVDAVGGGTASPAPAAGFDVAFGVKPKGGLFKKAEPGVSVFARVVPQADAAAVEESWPLALKAAGKEAACVLLLGASGMATSRELAAAVAEQRRKSRGAGPVMVPVDVRDWEALYPPEAPAVVRAMLQWLREGKS